MFANRKSKERWGAFDEDWNLIVDGETESECRKALKTYREHATKVNTTYRVTTYYVE